MRTPERKPSDHGGDGGYEHCCRECRMPFRRGPYEMLRPVPEKANADGDICEECNEDPDPNE